MRFEVKVSGCDQGVSDRGAEGRFVPPRTAVLGEVQEGVALSCHGGPGYNPRRKFFAILYADSRILEHFRTNDRGCNVNYKIIK